MRLHEALEWLLVHHFDDKIWLASRPNLTGFGINQCGCLVLENFLIDDWDAKPGEGHRYELDMSDVLSNEWKVTAVLEEQLQEAWKKPKKD